PLAGADATFGPSCPGCADVAGSEEPCATGAGTSPCACGAPVSVFAPADALVASAAIGVGGGAAGLFIFVIANAAARPRTAMIPPITAPFDDPFFGASAAVF